MYTYQNDFQPADPNKVYYWEEAMKCWLEETKHKRTHRQDIQKSEWLAKYMNGKPMHEMTRDFIEWVLAHKENVKGATINRMIALIRAVLRKAKYEWEWNVKVPFFRMRPEAKQRIRWLTPEEIKRLLSCLPNDLADIANFSLATGLRRANVFLLEWSQVDLDNCNAWIYADQAKANKNIAVPLNATAMALLRKHQDRHPKRVFTSKGRPIKSYNARAWKRALKQANIHNFRWHDLRHCWAEFDLGEGHGYCHVLFFL